LLSQIIIHRVEIASQGLDLANQQLNDAQDYLGMAKQRVGDYQLSFWIVYW
jgi:uncharacterized protein YaaN involved in tellurite resistance